MKKMPTGAKTLIQSLRWMDWPSAITLTASGVYGRHGATCDGFFGTSRPHGIKRAVKRYVKNA
jgi:hypothetical protein